jgi:hypothetical protein
MALATKSKPIGEYTYKVTQLNAIEGRRVFAKFAKIAMPTIAAIKGKDLEDALRAGFTTLAANVDPADFDYFCDAFAPTTTVTGATYGDKSPKLSDVFATHFAGSYPEMLEWLYLCLEVNFGSFFAKAVPGQSS